MPDLFDACNHPDHERLFRAGWSRFRDANGTWWLSPDRREKLSEEEAVKRLEEPHA